MKRWKWATIVAILALVVACGAVGLLWLQQARAKAKLSWDDIPIYPGAYAMRRYPQSFSQTGMSTDVGYSSDSGRFTTRDSQSIVVDYYRSWATKNGWDTESLYPFRDQVDGRIGLAGLLRMRQVTGVQPSPDTLNLPFGTIPWFSTNEMWTDYSLEIRTWPSDTQKGGAEVYLVFDRGEPR